MISKFKDSWLKQMQKEARKHIMCKTCDHWFPQHDVIKWNGECRKSHPVWDGRKPTSADHPKDDEFRDWSGSSAIWPTTLSDDTCGDHSSLK